MTTIGTVHEAVALLGRHGLDLAGVEPMVVMALAEDLGGYGVLPAGTSLGVDVTSVATIPADAEAEAEIVARAAGRLAGAPVAAYVLALVCAEAGPVRIEVLAEDGDDVARGDVVLRVRANTRALLRAERVALNLLTMISGVATATAAWAAALEGTATQVRDSRKTVPGLRMLQKYAVRAGGGVNHRLSLADAALIKDNHVVAAGGVVAAFEAVRREFPDIGVQVEVDSAEQARAVIAAGATEILLDNMSPREMAAMVSAYGEEVIFEASGGLTLAAAAKVAATGVHFVAVGAITHSAPILDFALDFRG
ncbi:MAG TPA: carboxylating nicotinate-nucleotide diphosphorylase [Microlunatus sp.]|nr:carboxylating nicotinate-nucleotide diphosphorylase [Microlunatus sp.]